VSMEQLLTWFWSKVIENLIGSIHFVLVLRGDFQHEIINYKD